MWHVSSTWMRELRWAALPVAIMALPAAGGANGDVPTSPPSVTTPTPVAAGTPAGSMSATIDGARWVAVVIREASIQGGVLRVGGQDSTTAPFVALGIAVPPTVGTDTVSAATGATVAGSLAQVSPGSAVRQWNANFAFGSGTITLTTLTATAARGTFSFTLVHIATGSTGTRGVADGVFDVTF